MKRLLMDIEKCSTCKDRACLCSYLYHPHNNGVNALLEEAMFTHVCRQCHQAPCIKSCPNQALERPPDANLKRHNARCISCKSCMLACPFGAIIPQVLSRLSSKCDVCVGRLADDEEPLCVVTCPHAALEYAQVKSPPEKNVYLLGDYLAVGCIPRRNEA